MPQVDARVQEIHPFLVVIQEKKKHAVQIYRNAELLVHSTIALLRQLIVLS